MPNFTIGPWHFKEQGRSRLFSSYICYAGQTLHEGNSCTTGLCLGKASSQKLKKVWLHHRIVGASRSTVEQVHVTTATAKETSRTGFQLADRDNYGPCMGERTLPTLPATRLASRKMQCPESSAVRKLFESIWARCHSACRGHQKLADRSVDRTSTFGTRKIATDVEWLRENENYVWRSTPPPSNLVAKC